MAVTQDRVLVTGGAGFIGVNLAPVLAELGLATRCFDNFSTGRRGDAERASYDEIVEGDILDAAALTAAARGCTHVVHLAAQAGVPASVDDPVADCEVNVRGTLHALLAARDAGVRAFVLASSGAPLGEVDPPGHEELAPRPPRRTAPPSWRGEGLLLGVRRLVRAAARWRCGSPTSTGPFSYHKGSVVAAFMKRIWTATRSSSTATAARPATSSSSTTCAAASRAAVTDRRHRAGRPARLRHRDIGARGRAAGLRACSARSRSTTGPPAPATWRAASPTSRLARGAVRVRAVGRARRGPRPHGRLVPGAGA